MKERARRAAEAVSQEEGDRLCELVLQLVRQLAEDAVRFRERTPGLDPIRDVFVDPVAAPYVFGRHGGTDSRG